MQKKRKAFIKVMLAMIIVILCGSSCMSRGLYDPNSAEECFVSHRDELQSAADCMQEYSNLWYVMRGDQRGFDTRNFELIDGYSVFSEEPLCSAEIYAIKNRIIPAFSDNRLESIRRHPTAFAGYVVFCYQYSLSDNIYKLCKEIRRSGEGELIDLSYITDQHDLGDGWYSVRYSS